jgi:hypothetical protein
MGYSSPSFGQFMTVLNLKSLEVIISKSRFGRLALLKNHQSHLSYLTSTKINPKPQVRQNR